jgi:hypothetical protein
VGNYDEMSTARLRWLVLDRIVPRDEEAYARAALIARDPEIQSLVNQGLMTEDEALEKIRTGQTRYGDDETMLGDRLVLWVKRAATFLGGTFFAWILIHVLR